MMIKVTKNHADETDRRKIKSRMVADGSKHRSYEELLAIIDVENAFLQSDNDQRI